MHLQVRHSDGWTDSNNEVCYCGIVQDLKEAVAALAADPKLAKSGNAPLYGMAAVVPDRSIVGEFLVAFQDLQLEL